ncbi:pyridoxamine 5'-phosphate oxidase family protein [Mucilaginibacter sp.]|uniref:pyridoxamine 5'-phosphate oxidase family protein n=1 Tax=Mucilaginibacter sp. TaxID=1882438 RepID=UPI003D0A3E9D
MLGELNNSEMETLLKEQVIGRIGCHFDGLTYVVPVNYIYDGECIYAHSAKGMKIDMMRKNPEVCFEADEILSMTSWQSVIAWGRFEEITEMGEKQDVMQKISNKIMPLIGDEFTPPSHGFVSRESEVGTSLELILYKIIISRKTGRFENR